MLKFTFLPKTFWVEAITTYYLQNWSLTSSIPNTTPFKTWYSQKPDLNNLQIFGWCLAHVHVLDENKKNSNIKSFPCTMLGYGEQNGVKTYKVYDKGRKQVILNHVVVFYAAILSYVIGGDNTKTWIVEKQPVLDQPAIQNIEYECINIINLDKIYIHNNSYFWSRT
jgi:hypothetical protein